MCSFEVATDYAKTGYILILGALSASEFVVVMLEEW